MMVDKTLGQQTLLLQQQKQRQQDVCAAELKSVQTTELHLNQVAVGQQGCTIVGKHLEVHSILLPAVGRPMLLCIQQGCVALLSRLLSA